MQLLEDWKEGAAEAGLTLWERQPVETDIEWKVWRYYMDSYPCVEKPTFAKCAEDLKLTVKEVREVYLRWGYDARLQAWAKHIDTLNLDKRKAALVEMNERHIRMSVEVNKKMEEAINLLNPEELKPSDLKSLMNMATELERKARIDIVEVEATRPKDSSIAVAEEKSEVPKEDMKEVLEILMKAGVLKGDIGVRQTTEVVCKND